MSIAGVQGQLLKVTVVGCNKLKDTEWISRQDPNVCLEYASNKFRTRTCTDGGKNPVFQEKFVFTLIEGLREIDVVVWNSNTLTFDDYIGSGKVQLHDVLSRGYDDRAWPIQTKTGRHAGEVKLIMHFAKTNKPYASSAPSAPPYGASPQTQVSMYSAPPAASMSYINTTSAYPPPPNAYPPPPTAYPAYPSTSPYPYPPNPSAYPSYPYLPLPDHSAYPPSAYPPPPSAYPPPSYPPPHQAPPYPHSGHHPGMYPPPPY
ncbi:extensin-like [Chenopodium quinoa]|nr:extensin-like [Chenopodium quinoa]